MNPNDPDTSLLPRDAITGESLRPTDQPGYYRGFSTMSQKAYWDQTTRDVITMRVEQPPSLHHFTVDQGKFWRAVFDHLIPQHDRTLERRIPIVEPLDERLYQNRGSGYRYEKIPHDREAYRLGELAITEEAKARYNGEFLYLPHHQQDVVLKALHDGKNIAGKQIWKQMSIRRFWQLLMQDAIEAYYSHPWVWDEIGFGGPAYPRAYTRLERGEPEPWEVEEERHKWLAPLYAVSDVIEDTIDLHLESDQSNYFLE